MGYASTLPVYGSDPTVPGSFDALPFMMPYDADRWTDAPDALVIGGVRHEIGME
jgi:hypothetical protein